MITLLILYYINIVRKGKENFFSAPVQKRKQQLAIRGYMVYDGYNTDRIEELLMRPDGKRVKDLPPIVAAIPYIMPKRYDAWNTITENIDEEGIKAYIREKRRAGIRINHMAVIIAPITRPIRPTPSSTGSWSTVISMSATISASPLSS